LTDVISSVEQDLLQRSDKLFGPIQVINEPFRKIWNMSPHLLCSPPLDSLQYFLELGSTELDAVLQMGTH